MISSTSKNMASNLWIMFWTQAISSDLFSILNTNNHAKIHILDTDQSFNLFTFYWEGYTTTIQINDYSTNTKNILARFWIAGPYAKKYEKWQTQSIYDPTKWM